MEMIKRLSNMLSSVMGSIVMPWMTWLFTLKSEGENMTDKNCITTKLSSIICIIYITIVVNYKCRYYESII